ncbi:MAG TPA: DegT/DnrJ/EryC1/StrS family aminotransferase [Syntrophorhabdales bacterium]|nr:DegT/DnrJ/EryC1/StrS family aminotransferase [Syntrophorhabdales bacterium]
MNVPLIDLKAQYKKVERPILKKLKEILSEQRLILGKYCSGLEEAIAGYVGVSHAISCAHGSDALILSLMALGIKEGDEVITTPYTFFSTASSILLLGAKPVFVDIEEDDMNIDPVLIRSAVTPSTKAILPVHLFGKVCDTRAITATAEKHGLAVIEDMAQSLGARLWGTMCGKFGDIAALSFYPTKNLGGIGEGGMVLTKRDDLAQRAKKLRVHGMGETVYLHELVGINSRLDEIKACALLEKFPFLEGWNKKRVSHAAFYNKQLKGLPLKLPRMDPPGSHIFHQYVIRTEKRDALREHLQKKGVATGIYYPMPLHLQPCFANLGYKKGDFPIAEEASLTSLALPVFPELKTEQKEYVVASIREFFA